MLLIVARFFTARQGDLCGKPSILESLLLPAIPAAVDELVDALPTSACRGQRSSFVDRLEGRGFNPLSRRPRLRRKPQLAFFGALLC